MGNGYEVSGGEKEICIGWWGNYEIVSSMYTVGFEERVVESIPSKYRFAHFPDEMWIAGFK